MKSEGLVGYFDYVKDKTYIDKYPTSVITLDELRGTTIVEIGPGTFNDMMLLIQKGIVNPDSVFISEPHLPAFCDTLDKIEKLCGRYYAFMNRRRISNRSIPNLEFPDDCSNFVYANNVLLDLGYRTLGDELDLRAYEERGEGPPGRIQQLLMSPEEKIRDVVREAFRLLRVDGVFFGRTLTNYVDEELLATLEAKGPKTKTDEFAIWTARAVLDETLTGLSPNKLASMGSQIGFTRTYVEEEPPDPTKPRRNFYFRFEK